MLVTFLVGDRALLIKTPLRTKPAPIQKKTKIVIAGLLLRNLINVSMLDFSGFGIVVAVPISLFKIQA